MSVRIDGIPQLLARIDRYADRSVMAEACKAGCEVVRTVLQRDFLSGQAVGVGTGALRASWNIWTFESPVPGANLYTDLYYARILNRWPHRGHGFFGEAVQAARSDIKPAIVDSWRSGIGG